MPFFAFRRLLAAAFVLTAGCHYTTHEGSYANGDHGQLVFSPSGSTRDTTVAVGYAYPVTIQRFSAQDVNCKGLGLRSASPGAGGLHVQGGSINTDTCDSTKADPVTFVSASCEDDACTIETDTSNPRSVVLHVTGKRAAQTHLLVSLKSADGATTYDDSTPMQFGVPSRMRLRVGSRDLPATKSPVLVGLAIDPPSIAVLDADDVVLDVGPEPPKPAFEGDAYVASDDTRLVATRAGHTVMRWAYPGVPDRTLDLEVVDPAQARALFVYAPLPRDAAGTATLDPALDPTDFKDTATSGGRVTSLEVAQYDYKTFPTRVSLADGRLALAKVDTLEVTTANLVYADSGLDPTAFDVEGKAVGKGTLTVRAAPGATLTLPLTVTAPPAR